MSRLQRSKRATMRASSGRSHVLWAASLLLFFLGALFPIPAALAQTVTYDYDDPTPGANRIGRLWKVTDPTGSTTSTYDQRGRSTRVDKVIDGTTYTTQSTYDTLDRVVNMTYPDGEVVNHAYNGQGLLEILSSTTYSLNYVSTLGYNALDKVTSKSVGNGKTTTYTYDPSSFRLTGLSTSGLQGLSYSYDYIGNITALTDTIKAATQSFVYDDLDRLISASSLATPTYNHAYAYNAIGNMTSSAIPGWSIQTVDSTGTVGLPNSLKLDSSGNPHISYGDTTNGDLKYVRWTGNAWSIETVDSTGTVGGSSSLKLDSSGNPHISYYDATNSDLKYAKWTGTAWSIQIVDSTGNVGTYTSLALDGSGNPHISYYDATNQDLKYARWTGSSWSIETVDSLNNAGMYNSLALDSSGNPHIAYTENTFGSLRYAKWTGTAWSIQTLASTNANDEGARSLSLALDGSGNGHIAYSEAVKPWTNGPTSLVLNYVHFDGTNWVNWEGSSRVDSNSGGPSLVLDSGGNPHISYYDSTNQALKYAKLNHGSWGIQIVASFAVGQSSLALDSSGNPHISYYDGTNGDLKYAKLTAVSTMASFTYPPAGAARPHAPTSDGACSYGYDANGNLATRVCGSTTRAFTWNADNRLTQVADNGVTLATFTYDYAGARVKKVEGSNTTVYPFGHYKVVNGTTATKYYFANGGRVAERVGAAATDVYYYHPDHLGSSNVVTNSAGAEVKATLFYPYGSTRSESGTKEIIHKYTGKELDSSTGLYDYGARYYDPAFMHFITADSIVPSYADPQSLNHYSYVRNNPIRLIDPTGHSPEDVCYGQYSYQDYATMAAQAREARMGVNYNRFGHAGVGPGSIFAGAIQGAKFAGPLEGTVVGAGLILGSPVAAPLIVSSMGIPAATWMEVAGVGIIGSVMTEGGLQILGNTYFDAPFSGKSMALSVVLGTVAQEVAFVGKAGWGKYYAAKGLEGEALKQAVTNANAITYTSVITPTVMAVSYAEGADLKWALVGGGFAAATRYGIMKTFPMDTPEQMQFALGVVQRSLNFTQKKVVTKLSTMELFSDARSPDDDK